MLCSLSIIYILFAENFKAKISTNIFRFKTLIFLMILTGLAVLVLLSTSFASHYYFLREMRVSHRVWF